MFDFHEKRRIRRILFSKISIGVFFLLSILIFMGAYERYSVERDMAEKLDSKRQELDAMNQRAESLRAKVEHLENDRGIEEELRKRFDVAKEGEQVVIIIDESATQNATKTENEKMGENKKSEKRSWLELFKNW